jgi:hypothetical protein
MQQISVDMKNVTYEDGYLNINVAGFDIKLEVIPTIRLAPQLFNGEAALHANVSIGDSSISEGPKAIKTQEDLNIFLAKEPTLPTHWKYDDLLLGFIYSTDEDPENYNWFLQTRYKGKFGGRLTTSTNVNIHCPMATVSWFEGGNWHGRFCFAKKELKNIERVGTDLNVVGHKCGGHAIEDLSEIPEGSDRIVIRYNIHKNKWYLHFQKNGGDLKEIEVDGILTDCSMYGNVDRNHPKPKVTQFVKVEDVAHLKIMSNMAIIYGK